jgi:nucleotide-binding universal stress UspA family protein
MSYKDILVYADASKAAPVRFDVAAALATKYKAHLTALHVQLAPYVPVDFGAGVPAALIEWQEKFMTEQAEAAKQEVAAAQRRSGQEIEYRLVKGEMSPTALLHARYADLVVVSQSGQSAEEMTPADELPEMLVMGSGRPTLVVPRYGKFPTLGERVLVAWSRTRESTRAVHDALPFLIRAKSVTVMEVNPQDRNAPHIAGADIALHLARHNVKAEVASTTASEIEVGDAILSRAADLGADMLVMGAYGHSRMREYAFGGVTKHLLDHMTVPVLMSH